MTIKRASIDPTEHVAYSRTPRTYEWVELAQKLKADPGEWFEYDGFQDFEPSRSPIRVYASRINTGKLLCLADHGRFEAVAKGRVLFVRFLGE